MLTQAPDVAAPAHAPSWPVRAWARVWAVVGWGWLGPLLVTAVGGFLRFRHLDRPRQLSFDETYYVKQAWSMIRWGHERRWSNDATPRADDLWNQGTPDVFTPDADFVVHPPLGKWMIGWGEWLAGGPTTPWSWRLASAVVGTLSILMIARIGRRLFGSTLLGCTAGLLLAVDGQHFVHSRTGLLDVFLMFWAVAGFGCVLVDRDRGRRVLDRAVAAARGPAGSAEPGLRWRDLPWQWWWLRPWRIAAAACFGLAAGVKWSGVYFLAVFAVASVLWDVAAARSRGVRGWESSILPVGGAAAVTMLPAALGAYLATWTGWFRTTDAWDRHWSPDNPTAWIDRVPEALVGATHALRGLWHYHVEMYGFHVKLTSDHPYEANPWSWIVLGRPTAFNYLSPSGCGAPDCSEAVTALGNPVIWWGATLTLGVLLFRWLLSRDWRAGAVLGGLAAGYLPWFAFQERTIFTFYAIAFTPWVVLTLVYGLGLLLGPRTPPGTPRVRTGVWWAGLVVVLAVIAFAWFHPVLASEPIPREAWNLRMWLPSWI